MRLLLDTHILIWSLTDDPRLSDKARGMILDEKNDIYFSSVSVWEVALKHSIHPDNVSFTGQDMARYCEEAGFEPLNLKNDHVFALETIKRAADAPPHHDPFDRMLIAQAKAERMSFITHDPLLAGYGERCVIMG